MLGFVLLFKQFAVENLDKPSRDSTAWGIVICYYIVRLDFVSRLYSHGNFAIVWISFLTFELQRSSHKCQDRFVDVWFFFIVMEDEIRCQNSSRKTLSAVIFGCTLRNSIEKVSTPMSLRLIDLFVLFWWTFTFSFSTCTRRWKEFIKACLYRMIPIGFLHFCSCFFF